MKLSKSTTRIIKITLFSVLSILGAILFTAAIFSGSYGLSIIGLGILISSANEVYRLNKAVIDEFVDSEILPNIFYQSIKSNTRAWLSRQSDTINDIERNAIKSFENGRERAAQKTAFIERMKSRVNHTPLEVTVLGGSGWESQTGSKLQMSIDENNLYITDLTALKERSIPISNVSEIEIDGPGKVTGDAGAIGGGFDVEGILKGIAAATIINILTTHSNTKTVIRLSHDDSELILLTSKMEPETARILLSRVFVQAKRRQTSASSANSISDELVRLHHLKENGVITEIEFSEAKRSLIGR